MKSVYLKIGIVVVAFIAGFVVQGWRMGEDMAEFERALAEADAKQAAAVLSIERLSQERAEAISAKAAAQARAQATRATTITKEVIKYVQNPDTGHCRLHPDWVRSHDQAAGMPSVTTATGSSASAAAGSATDRDALIAVTENYNRCQSNIIQLKGLIDWARSVTKIEPVE